jgi:DNA-binding transcriptional MerR regulator
MNNIKNVFSIKDLENLSGIKAHTIRIWEKRYNVLEPMRTETNIRSYDLVNLQKLLNITLLHQYGYKISVISKLPPKRIPELVNEIVSEKSAKTHAISAFKMAMINFDQRLFITTYNRLLSEKTFSEVFYDVLIPLINEIGLLWQTDTINPSHEHFISYLIKHKLIANIEKIQALEPTKTDKIFVLYLPDNEIHELGLLYVNYELMLKGYKTIYLGQSIPLNNLLDIKKYYSDIVYVCYATVEPNKSYITNYVTEIQKQILDNNTKLWLIGRQTENLKEDNLKNVKIFNSIEQLVNNA